MRLGVFPSRERERENAGGNQAGKGLLREKLPEAVGTHSPKRLQKEAGHIL